MELGPSNLQKTAHGNFFQNFRIIFSLIFFYKFVFVLKIFNTCKCFSYFHSKVFYAAGSLRSTEQVSSELSNPLPEVVSRYRQF